MTAWQTLTETGRIVRMAIAAESTAKPTTLPATGASLDWTATATAGNVYGWTANDFNLTEDDFEFTDSEGDPIVVKPPTAAKKTAIIRDEVDTPDQIAFTSYEVGNKILDWATNVTESPTGTFRKSATHTRRALIIEIGGLGIHYFPSVEIMATTPGGGAKSLSTQKVTIEVFGTSAMATGYRFYQYQDA